jgi:8-oxo-(d)GTP phosphatase
MADQPLADEIRAAGAVVWQPAGAGGRVVLVHRPKYDDWSFPKGKLEPGEHALVAALREVAEETGLRVTLGRRLPPVRYGGGSAAKRVDYWAATVAADPGSFVPTAEIDGVAWVAAHEAAARLSYQRDAETLAAFRAGPPRTVPLILLRHASAGSKADWDADDQSRPLDEHGLHEAAVLADLLSCFGASRVISSPAERCLATVRPYAARAGVPVEIEPALEVVSDGAAADDAEVGKTVGQLAAADHPVVICAHRENLQTLLAAACAELGAERPSGEPLRKGDFLVLHRAQHQLAALERYGAEEIAPA